MWRKKPLNWFPSPLFVVLLPRLYSGVWNMVLESKKGNIYGWPSCVAMWTSPRVDSQIGFPYSWEKPFLKGWTRRPGMQHRLGCTRDWTCQFFLFLFLLLFFVLFYRLLKVDYCSPPVCSPIRDTASIWDKSLSACRDHRWSLCPVHSSLDRVLKRWYWGGGKK